MRKIKEVLRLHQEIGFSERQIAKSCGISRSTVKDYLNRAQRAELAWPLPSNLDDAQLENLLFPPIPPIAPENRGMPPMDYLYQELKKKGVTLQLLWCEYKQSNPEGYQYSQFCKRYQKWVDKLDVCLRQEHRAGEKLFVDYAGQTIPVQNPLTGQIQEAYLFVAALGASHSLYLRTLIFRDNTALAASALVFGTISMLYEFPITKKGEAGIMKTSARVFLLAGLVLSFAVSTFAQESLWNELTTKVIFLYQQGRYSEAAKVAEEALNVAKKTSGPDHPYTAQSLNNLAELYRTQGKYADAEPLYKRSLKIVEKALGKDHPYVAASLNNLALLYQAQGKYAEAASLYKRALAIDELGYALYSTDHRM